jgi:hypothetical protein
MGLRGMPWKISVGGTAADEIGGCPKLDGPTRIAGAERQRGMLAKSAPP